MPYGGKLGANLVRAPGEQLRLHKAHSVVRSEHGVFCLCSFGAGRRGGKGFHRVGLFVFQNEMFQHAAFAFRRALYHAEILFLKLAVLYLVVQHPKGGGIFCGYNNAAGVAVNSVAKGGNKGIFRGGVIFVLFIEIMLNSRNKGICARSLREQEALPVCSQAKYSHPHIQYLLPTEQE